ncbi:MAG: DUF1697 domain-containing protein [Alkalibacterium sp.]|nr:DUF1697 domain-containing protein [Alkalibacterium sp.]
MKYVALLRGINVGGKNKLNVEELKRTVENSGMTSVSTYINSGNVIFENEDLDKGELSLVLKEVILKTFGLNIDILIRSRTDLSIVMETLPKDLKNDKTMKSDVLFLFEEIDNESILNDLTIKQGIDTVCYVPGALIWTVDRNQVSKSGMMKLAGSALYKKMTLRNVNTTRHLYELLSQ